MKMLRATSIISVLCTLSILIYVVPPLLSPGVVEVGGRGLELLVVLPTLVGLPCSLAGAVVGTACILQRRTRGPATVLMALGQVATVALAAAILVWAFGFASTGWELVALPAALMVGQLMVAAGLVVTFTQRSASSRRTIGNPPAYPAAPPTPECR
ncbi:hypothetical protein [Rhodococcus sp. CH91]|uniref:hypothetical protein n=1 Tax=Rhodococcus sp. CH91 TaxID=2910256 RepID=UPI001F4ABEE0|nr:hypothetical protein [Rhodococcus sp. CH91]